LLEPLSRRVRFTKRKDLKTLPDGSIYGLFQSYALGSGTDLWIARREGAHWVNPTFTSLAAYDPIIREIPDPPEEAVEDVTYSTALKGAWTRLVGSPTLTTDTDRDGLPDLVESRRSS
jgi:hypothetical protein